MPTRGYGLRGQVPDLTQIHPDAWREVLIPLTHGARLFAATHPLLERAARVRATALVDSMPPPPSVVAQAEMTAGVAIPVPAAGELRRPRQVNFRLLPGEHAALARAAAILGTRPGQLARMLTLNGVRRVLAEHDAALDRARNPPATER